MFIGSRRLNMKNAYLSLSLLRTYQGVCGQKLFCEKIHRSSWWRWHRFQSSKCPIFLSYSHYKIKGPYEKKTWFRPGRHRHMNSQIMENVIQYYLHVYDSALRIYSQKKSEYRTANYLYCGQKPARHGACLMFTSKNTFKTGQLKRVMSEPAVTQPNMIKEYEDKGK